MNTHKLSAKPTRIVRKWIGLFLLLSSPMLTSCMTTRIVTEPDCDTPANMPYSQTTVTAYFWGLMQPTDLTPPCDKRSNHLNSVTVKSTFGQYLLSTITLGIVHKQQVKWCCTPFVPEPGKL